jgi:hypothetical protein
MAQTGVFYHDLAILGGGSILVGVLYGCAKFATVTRPPREKRRKPAPSARWPRNKERGDARLPAPRAKEKVRRSEGPLSRSVLSFLNGASRSVVQSPAGRPNPRC